MGRHRSAGGVAEADDFSSSEVIVGQQSRALKNDVEGTFQIAVEDFVVR
jgi:hypothetical protein